MDNIYDSLKKKIKKKPFFIAEVGVNHNGKMKNVFKLIDAAKKANCDAVKFQTWVTDKVYSEKSLKPDYQKTNTSKKLNEYNLIKKLELKFQDFIRIKKYCERKKILFFSTPDEEESADFLDRIGTKIFKISSQDLTNLYLIKYMTRFKKPLILSTGASRYKEIKSAVNIIKKKTNKFIILHCLSSYPAPYKELNLNFIQELTKRYTQPIGFSDHTIGYESACAAVALGARVFEKHLTFNKKQRGPDHSSSLSPIEMVEYVEKVTNAFNSLGNKQKKIMPSELNTRKAFSRFLVSNSNLKKGQILSIDNVLQKKTINGIHAKYKEHFLNKKLLRPIKKNENFKWSHIKK